MFCGDDADVWEINIKQIITLPRSPILRFSLDVHSSHFMCFHGCI